MSVYCKKITYIIIFLQVLCDRDLLDPFHDPGRHDQQEVLKPVSVDYRTDQHVPPHGTEATEEGRTNPRQQCAEAGVCPAKGGERKCVGCCFVSFLTSEF